MTDALAKAEASARRALALEPESETARLLLARVLLKRGGFQEAESLARQALAVKPQAQEYQYLLAQALLEQGRQDEGARAVSLIMSRPPVSAAARELMSDLLTALKSSANRLMYAGRFAEAEKMLAEAGSHLKDDSGFWFLRGKLARFQHQAAKAEAAYRKAAALARGDLQAYLYLAETQLLAGKVPAALKTFSEAAKKCPVPASDDAEGKVLRYRLAVCRQEFAQAGRLGDGILGARPSLALVEKMIWPVIVEDFDMFARPPAYLKRGLESSQAFLGKSPKSPWAAYFHLYNYRYTRHDLSPQARQGILERCARVSELATGGRAWMRYLAGTFRLALSDFGPAADDFAAAAATTPRSWRALGYCAETLLFLRKPERAWKAFDEALALAPDDAARDECRAWKAKGLLWAGRAEEALNLCGKISGAGTLRDAYAVKGGALAMIGRCTEALAVLDAGLAEFPVEEARVWRLEALYRLGRFKDVAADRTPDAEINFYIQILRALAFGKLGDAARLREECADLPEHVVVYARQKLGLTAGWSQELLAGILSLSGGVRRSGNQTALWKEDHA